MTSDDALPQFEAGESSPDPEEKETIGTIAIIYFISPASALSLLPTFFYLEAEKLLHSPFVYDSHLLAECIMLTLIAGFISLSLIWVELRLVELTSSLTLGIAGHLKSAVQILLAVVVFHDHLGILNGAGLFIAMVGMVMYTYIKNSSPKDHEEKVA